MTYVRTPQYLVASRCLFCTMDLLNQPFKLYKANLAPKLEQAHLAQIEQQLAVLLFNKYQAQNADLVPRYSSPDDVHELISVTYTTDQVPMLSIRAPQLPRQRVAFIQPQSPTSTNETKTFNTLVMIRLPIASFLIQQFEALEFPLVVKPVVVSTSAMGHFLNGINDTLSTYSLSFGESELVYTTPLANDLLRYVTLTFLASDINSLRNKPLMDSITTRVGHSSKIAVDKLTLHKFTSSFVLVSNDGRIRLNTDPVTEEILQLLREAVTGSQ